MLKYVLNKGGAGISLSREETVQRLNPLIRKHYALNHCYHFVIENHPEREVAAQLEAFQKIARADVGKLAETVFSAGGVAYNGIDMEPGDFDLGTDPDTMIRQLVERERAFQEAVAAESDVKHQIRTRAVLTNVRTNSQARLNYLHGLEKTARRAKAS